MQFNINSPGELLRLISVHLQKKKPFSLVRIGDGENFILAQDTIHPVQELINMYNVVADSHYSGIAIPNLEARDRLVQAIRKADVVGILNQTDCYCWYPLTEKVFNYYSLSPPNICHAFINRYCATSPVFYELFRQAGVLLIGRPMARLKEVLERRYQFSNIVEVLNLRDYRDLNRVLRSLPRYDFELALISAGANGKIVSEAVKDLGKVAFDLGHAADNIIANDGQGLYAWGVRYMPMAGTGRINRPGVWRPLRENAGAARIN